MKKIYKFLLIAIVSFSTLFYSCDTLELEQLTNPNALSPDLADPDLMLNSIQLSYRSTQRSFQGHSARLARINYMSGRNYLATYDGGTLDFVWNQLYSSILPNLQAIEASDAANTNKDLSFHRAVGKTLQAHTLMQLVDFLGDVPWSQSGNPSEFPTPTVDDDEAVYNAAIAMLVEAKLLFGSTSGIGTGTDLYYGGDASKWIKLINTLQMRTNLTLKNYSAVASATGVIVSTSDDFQFNYGTNVLAPDTRHPDYAADYTSSGANIYQSNWLISRMVGQYGDLSSDTDPRRRYYFYRQNWRTPGSYALYEDVNGAFGPAGTVLISNGAGNGETLSCSLQSAPTHLQFTPDENIWCSLPLGYWGRFHGNDEGTPPDGFTRTAVGVYPAGGSFDWRADAFPYVGVSISASYNQAVGLGNGGGGAGIDPIYLASYVDFMKAEANLALGNTVTAATNFKAGLTKSIAKVQSFGALDGTSDKSQAPNAATVTAFIDAKVAEFNAAAPTTTVDANGFPTTKDKMDILGEQYFVAMYGGAGDAFNFIRRTGYPRTLSRNIDSNPGTFPRTVFYPDSEVSANPNILQRTDLSTTVFWDSGVVNPAN